MPTHFDPQKHHRRSIRLPKYDYTTSGGYYITIVTQGRECLFGEVVDGEMRLNALGQIAKREWERLPKRFKQIELGIYVIMPNHAHGIIFIREHRRGTAEYANLVHQEDNRRAPTAAEYANLIHQEDNRRAPAAEYANLVHQEDNRRAPTTAECASTIHQEDNRRAPTAAEQFGKPVSGSIPTIIRSYKSAVALRLHYARPNDTGPVWQRNYYEHIIRDDSDYNRIHNYIETNPLAWADDIENPANKKA
jgi:putative transposase